MPTPVQTLFNPTIGIQTLMPMPEQEALPAARDVGTSALAQSTLQTLYGPTNAQTRIEGFLCPDVGDGTLVAPEVFQRELRKIAKKLRKSKRPEIRSLVENELEPLEENEMLLSAYRGLMLGG